jgi:hypothetical protein
MTTDLEDASPVVLTVPAEGRPSLSLVPDEPAWEESVTVDEPEPDGGPVGIDERWWPVADWLDGAMAAIRASNLPRYPSAGMVLGIALDEKPDYCVMGPRFASLNRRDRRYRSQYGRCKGGKCPRCLDYWLHRVMRRALTWLDFPEMVRRAWLPSYEAVPERLRKASFWVRQADGSVIVLGPTGVGEDVEARSALLQALLGAKAYPGQRERRHKPLPKEQGPDPDPDVRWVPLGQGQRVEDVNLRVSQVLDRDVDWLAVRELGKRRSPYSARWDLPLEDDAEVQAVDGVLDTAKCQADAEWELMLFARTGRCWLTDLLSGQPAG